MLFAGRRAGVAAGQGDFAAAGGLVCRRLSVRRGLSVRGGLVAAADEFVEFGLVFFAQAGVGGLVGGGLLDARVCDQSHASEFELGRGADQVAGLLVRVARQADDDVAVALRGDLSFGDAGGVHALADDLDSLFQLVGRHIRILDLRFEDDGGAALQVEGEFGGQGGVGPDCSRPHQGKDDRNECDQAKEPAARPRFAV